VRCPQCGHPLAQRNAAAATRDLSTARVQGRARIARILHDIAYATPENEGVSLVDAWAAQLTVSDETIRNWCDPTRTRACPAFGDIDALDDDSVERIVRRWLEDRAARRKAPTAAVDPRLEVLALAGQVGRAADTAAEVVSPPSAAGTDVTADEWARVEGEFARSEEMSRAAKLRARAAKLAARAKEQGR